MNIPEGYVLVPVEPTEEMLEVMHESVKIEVDTLCRTASIINDKQWWSSVICASPNVKIPDYDEAKERELFESQKFDKVPAYRKPNGDYKDFMDEEQWEGWKSCAKSRARSAE